MSFFLTLQLGLTKPNQNPVNRLQNFNKVKVKHVSDHTALSALCRRVFHDTHWTNSSTTATTSANKLMASSSNGDSSAVMMFKYTSPFCLGSQSSSSSPGHSQPPLQHCCPPSAPRLLIPRLAEMQPLCSWQSLLCHSARTSCTKHNVRKTSNIFLQCIKSHNRSAKQQHHRP